MHAWGSMLGILGSWLTAHLTCFLPRTAGVKQKQCSRGTEDVCRSQALWLAFAFCRALPVDTSIREG